MSTNKYIERVDNAKFSTKLTFHVVCSCCETWPAHILSQRFGKLKEKILRIQAEKKAFA